MSFGSNYDKSSAKFLSGTLMVIEKLGRLSFCFSFIIRTTVNIILNVIALSCLEMGYHLTLLKSQ